VLAYIGNAGPDSRARFVDGVRARRQAGSTLKPFLYGLVIERGYLTAASLLQDAPVNLEKEIYHYDGLLARCMLSFRYEDKLTFGNV
jgi:membrane carboxypeptidase/penicillin-binding protein PbpC